MLLQDVLCPSPFRPQVTCLWPILPHRWGPLKHRPAWQPRFNPGSSTQSPREPKGLLKSCGVRGFSKEVPAGFPSSVSGRGCTRGMRGGSNQQTVLPLSVESDVDGDAGDDKSGHARSLLSSRLNSFHILLGLILTLWVVGTPDHKHQTLRPTRGTSLVV